jgi:hypothetical protein
MLTPTSGHKTKKALFTRRLGIDREGVDACIEFRFKQLIDCAMAVDAALAFKGIGDHLDLEMRSARAMRGTWTHDGVGVPGVFMRLVDHLK